ncbi:exodeoxyribonuclease V subunit gamma [Reichenbachiella carrageenanivorans]|uniref:Exodeoxyribonuclease V subunit gamma n=1 Tax=Reichenbachiella carrageenanivorans TaxID=2979869 RepID=A0ABY6CXZ4_9BACT|nr:PD-(D/E)XK nuclease family protein [Reichenbachiella carrageenanivorans]UXX78792.1 exodeoxyribonuclease V subunit gamma [Reichenbachiella carrageenanivorans]
MTNDNNFLQSLAQKCQDQFDHQCDRLTVIFPNKRAGVYFADYLAQLYDRPIWSPAIMSFEEFVEIKQTKNYADDLQMIFLLYKAYQEIVKQPEDFDAFFPWGEMILKDYNDIDNYLVDVAHIFRVIKSQKELDEAFRHLSEQDQQTIQSFWKGFLPTPNKKQDEFIATWSILAELYHRFNELLTENGLIYKGQMFRTYAEQVIPIDEGSTLWFAGFNALTKAEEQIIKTYLAQGQTDIFWDVDAYYFNDENQESGTFFRTYAQDEQFKPSIIRDLKETIAQTKLHMEVLSAPFSMGQIKGAAQKIDRLSLTAQEQSQLLVILTDESLLQGMLHALPTHIAHANVTMGWSVAQARIYLFLAKVIAIHDKYQANQVKKIHHREILALLEYNDLLSITQERVTRFDQAAIKGNQIYQSVSDIKSDFPELGQILDTTETTQSLLTHLIAFISDLDLPLLSDLDRSVTVLIHGTLKRIDKAMSSHGIQLNFNSFHKLYLKLGTTLKLPLSGDHKQGIQVMGILETRNLSFKHVLIVGMNEGQWPKDGSNTSFIPYNIRKAFDLPTVEHQDAMQSYLFYRLLHSAENLWISYNNISEFNHNGELSRYVKQLAYETELPIIKTSLVNPIVAEIDPIIRIEKKGKVLEQLHQFLVHPDKDYTRLSPSALNTYIDCKLKFYFQHLEKIKEPKELVEDMDPSLFGNLLHGAMEHLYMHQKYWTTDDISTAKKQLDQAILQSFADQKLGNNAEQTGRQLIAYEVIKSYMLQILAFDEQHAPFNILGLEAKDFNVDFPIETTTGSVQVGLKGIIDRIDEYGEVVRILDYKSGRDERTFGLMEELIDSQSNKRNKAVFQLFYYSMLYKENHPDQTRPIQPGLFNSKDLFSAQFDTQLTQKEGRKGTVILNYLDYESEFKTVLSSLLTEIFDPSVAFSQTEDEKKCQYCIYQQICMKG